MDKRKIIDHYDQLANQRDKWMKKNKYYHKNVRNLYRFLVPEGANILEVGCGTGGLLAELKPKRGVGIDVSPQMIKIAAEKHPHLDFRVQDIENLQMDETFDMVILSDTVGGLSDVWRAFRQIRQVCKPDTKIIISHYNYLWEPVLKLAEKCRLKMPQYCQNWLSAEDIENLLELNDFQVVKKGFRQLLPVNIPIISRLANQYVSQLPLMKHLCLNMFVVAKFKAPRMQKNPQSVSVVIPARNEKGNIENAVRRTPDMGTHTEIIFVEGHSTDGTLDEIKRVKNKYPDKDIKIILQDGKGKGDAVRKGFASAKGDILMILDADLTVPPKDLEKFYLAITEDKGEFINGSRLVYPMDKEAMRFLNLLGNKFFSMMFTWLLSQKLKDSLCGTKVLTRQNYEKIADNRHYFGDFDPFGDFDLLFGAAKQNLKIVEMPIRYNERVYGSTNIDRFRHGWILLRMCAYAMKKIKFIR